MSLLLSDGEVIEIPEYIVRIVNKAQEIVSGENDDQRSPTLNLLDGEVLSRFRTDDFEPTVIGPDGGPQTVSEYILGIIRAAQKIVQEDSGLEDEIKDYDQFIDSTFDSMLNEVDSDTNEESSFVIQDVVEKLIDEVCNTKITMPEMETSIVSTVQEDIQDSTEIQPASEHQDVGEFNDDTDEVNDETVKVNIDTVVVNDAFNENDDTVNEETIKIDDETVTVNNDTVSVNEDGVNEEDKVNSQDNSEEVILAEGENVDKREIENEEKTVEHITEKDSSHDTDELERIAEKFVENICKDVKNELFIEEENKTNEIADSNNDIKESSEVGVEEPSPVEEIDTGAKDTANGQIDQKQDKETVENRIQNHTAKVHPEETKPVVTNLEDITQSESLPSEGKHGKEQKYDVSKDKIKPKRRSRGLRNSFRRMFSCFSTKSSQLE